MIALYRKLTAEFQAEADALGYRPHELQAALWILIQETADAEQWDGSRPTHKAEPAPF